MSQIKKSKILKYKNRRLREKNYEIFSLLL